MTSPGGNWDGDEVHRIFVSIARRKHDCGGRKLDEKVDDGGVRKTLHQLAPNARAWILCERAEQRALPKTEKVRRKMNMAEMPHRFDTQVGVPPGTAGRKLADTTD
jgi:hypothetical protein